MTNFTETNANFKATFNLGHLGQKALSLIKTLRSFNKEKISNFFTAGRNLKN